MATADTTMVRRLAFWANHGTRDEWKRMVADAGWEAERHALGYVLRTPDGRDVAHLLYGQNRREWFAFAWVPEARRAWWRRLLDRFVAPNQEDTDEAR